MVKLRASEAVFDSCGFALFRGTVRTALSPGSMR